MVDEEFAGAGRAISGGGKDWRAVAGPANSKFNFPTTSHFRSRLINKISFKIF